MALKGFLSGLAMLAGVGAAGADAPLAPLCSGARLAPEEAALGDYAPTLYPEGIVFYDRYPLDGRNAIQVIVEHCPSRWRMAAELPIPQETDTPWTRIDGYRTRVFEALNDSEEHSLGDLANWAVAAGGQGRTLRVDWQSCACAMGGGQ
ncbi:hypothetical protein [Pararhodobacter aggregans]|uniref:Uncharacterized protein n=1 Tax=Pararhodobacter aggregans TaxID=404875 RepID=A0A2T7UL23_9RHOB|nr:hypothetical protein [Pararhodobacter aggregans]PTX05409.1 hypothetical protein C8N33_101828 [Pararhodobacter aggregans]PVE45349.1 hypothetical protein DDE23_21385 [Pararhodobacter aggregans]